MSETQAFYKDDNGLLLYAPNGVYGPDYTLLPELHDTYTYPVEGWYWFESEEEAKAFFNIRGENP